MSLIEKALAVDVGALGNTFTGTSVVSNKFDTVANTVTTLIGWLLWVVGILAFVYLVYAGILYITANGNDEQAKKGQKGIINAVIGIIIVVLAGTIITMVTTTAQNGIL